MALSSVCVLSAHAYRLASSLGVFEEVAQMLFANFETLLRSGVGHSNHRAPEIQGIRDVGTDAEENEEDEVHRVA